MEQSCHKPSVRTNHICHITPPAGSVSLPSSLHSFALLPPLDSDRPTLHLPSATSQTTSTTAAALVTTSTTSIVMGGISSYHNGTTKDQPFTLASSFPPVPAKLVKRIQALEFVEMRELLPDNMALSARLLGLPSSSRQESYPQREIAGILPWTCAFTTYVAVVTQTHPERVKDMLAYMRLVVGTAQKFKEGRGWLTYDTVVWCTPGGGLGLPYSHYRPMRQPSRDCPEDKGGGTIASTYIRAWTATASPAAYRGCLFHCR